jgi:hypothetical protein
MDIRDAVVESAAQNDPIGGGHQLTDHLFNYTDETGGTYDAGETIVTGDAFPTSPNQGDYFIRADFQPNRLFSYRDSKWIRMYDNIDTTTWSDRTFNASTFVNNIETDANATGEYDSRQSITDAILARPDYSGTDILIAGVDAGFTAGFTAGFGSN